MPVEQVRRKQRHEKILEAALNVFAQKGYHEAAVDDIAAASETSKGGVYFHFPNKHALFLALLDRMAGLLRARVEAAIADEPDPIARADIALQVVLQTFASHRTLSRLFFVEALGAGGELNQRMAAIRASFADLIARHLQEAVRQGAIPPIDTAVAGRVWFGALNEVVTAWVMGDVSARLEDSYPTVRALLLRSIGAQLPGEGEASSLSASPGAGSRPASFDGLRTSGNTAASGDLGVGHTASGDATTGRESSDKRGSSGNQGASGILGVKLSTGDEASARSIETERDVARVAAMTRPSAESARLRQLLAAGVRQARGEGRAIVASAVMPVGACDPLTFYSRAAAVSDERAFWSRPRAGFALAITGAAWAVASDERDFQTAVSGVDQSWRSLVERAVVDAPPDTIGVGPLLLGGLAFDPERERTPLWEGFPTARFVLPSYQLTVVDGATWLTLNAVVEPDADIERLASDGERDLRTLLGPDGGVSFEHAGAAPRVEDLVAPAKWQKLVASAAAAVRGGDLEKVVLARGCAVSGEQVLDPVRALQRLRTDYPSCFVFAVGQGEHCFLGASPERLVRLRGRVVSTMCLAGTSGRGQTEAEDRALGDALLASAKERTEHAVVVDGLRAALADACEEVAPTSTPVLLKVRNVQHLLTTVVGKVAEDRSILDVVRRLHPSPAVGGQPREAALAYIREREGLDRGWYAGPIGWLDAGGEGEFAVAIRSGLIRGCEATLFAGCGIVADSDPEAEYAESRLKLRPMLAALDAAEAESATRSATPADGVVADLGSGRQMAEQGRR